MRRNILLLLAASALVGAPLSLLDGSIFNGTDTVALESIRALAPDYRPWVEPLWKPPGTEVESLLFALQAALGAGVIGYYFGLRKGRAEAVRER